MPLKNKSRVRKYRRYKTGKNRSRLRTRSRRSRKKRYSGGSGKSRMGAAADSAAARPRIAALKADGWVSDDDEGTPVSPPPLHTTPSPVSPIDTDNGWIEVTDAHEIAKLEGMAAVVFDWDRNPKDLSKELEFQKKLVMNLRERSNNLEKYIWSLTSMLYEAQQATVEVEKLRNSLSDIGETNLRLLLEKSKLIRESLPTGAAAAVGGGAVSSQDSAHARVPSPAVAMSSPERTHDGTSKTPSSPPENIPDSPTITDCTRSVIQAALLIGKNQVVDPKTINVLTETGKDFSLQGLNEPSMRLLNLSPASPSSE